MAVRSLVMAALGRPRNVAGNEAGRHMHMHRHIKKKSKNCELLAL